MEGMGLKLTPCLGLWLALPGLMASPNDPNEGYSLPLASHPPTPSPSHPSTPYNVSLVILQTLWKKVAQVLAT